VDTADLSGVTTDDIEQRELMLNRFKRLFSELMKGRIARNNSLPGKSRSSWISKLANCRPGGVRRFCASISARWSTRWKPVRVRP
jgi:hypothetical protein